MYNDYQFQSAKYDLSYGILHSPDKPEKRVEASFLRNLLITATMQGYVTQEDVQRAIEESGALELPPKMRDDVVTYLQVRGKDYIGGLSRHQLRELRRLRYLCFRIVKGDIIALSQFAEII